MPRLRGSPIAFPVFYEDAVLHSIRFRLENDLAAELGVGVYHQRSHKIQGHILGLAGGIETVVVTVGAVVSSIWSSAAVWSSISKNVVLHVAWPGSTSYGEGQAGLVD
ncbi:MAG: hypothetical protein U0S12_12180 [Fimbriimonadales bacterium]